MPSFDISVRDTDNLGIDATLRKVKNHQKIGRVLEVQLKASFGLTNFQEEKEFVKYKIGTEFFDKHKNNEDDLILVILRLPPKEQFGQWIEINTDYTKLQKCGYFKKVLFKDRSTFIQIPKTNLLNSENLNSLFEKGGL